MFLKLLFFLPAIAFIYYEWICISSPGSIVAMRKLMTDKEKKVKEWGPGETVYFIIHLCYTTWGLIGLLSSQWFLIGIIIVLGFIPKKWNWFVVLDSIITTILLVFIILNAFHFHINTFRVFMNYLG